MDVFVQTALSFPTVLFSFLLCLAMLYWCVAALGILEVDLLDIEADSALDSVQPEGLAGLLLRLGLNGVPVTLVLSLLFFFAWLASYFVELLLLSHLPLGVLRYPLGLLVALAALALAVPPSALLCRPLRTTAICPSTDLLVVACSLRNSGRSGRVTLQHGEAVLEDGGAGLILRVRADEARGFKRGDRVVLLEYLEGEHAYRVITEDEFQGR